MLEENFSVLDLTEQRFLRLQIPGNVHSSKGYVYIFLYTFFQPAFLGNCPGVSRETVEYTISKYRETLQVLRTTDVLGQLVSCPETTVRNYHCLLRNNTEERSSHVLH